MTLNGGEGGVCLKSRAKKGSGVLGRTSGERGHAEKGDDRTMKKGGAEKGDRDSSHS